jgi:TonB family protein
MPLWFILCCLLFSIANAGAKEALDSVRPYTVDRISPKYPVEAQKNHVEGRVLVEILVNKGGSVESIQILESEPQNAFDSAVLEAVSQWKFIPACGANFSEPFRVQAPFMFAFKSNKSNLPIINISPPLIPALPTPIATRSDKGIRIKRPGLSGD